MARLARDRRGRYLPRKTRARRGGYRRRARRNQPVIAAVNPRRRRRGARAGYRPRARRNPPAMLGKLGGLIPPPKRLIAGVAGSISTRMLPNLVKRFAPQVPLPVAGVAGLGVQAVLAIIAGMLLGRFYNRQAGEDFAFGGLVAVADKAVTEFGPQMGLPVGAYLEPDALEAYITDLDAYISPGETVPALEGGLGEDDEFEDRADLSGAETPTRVDPNARF